MILGLACCGVVSTPMCCNDALACNPSTILIDYAMQEHYTEKRMEYAELIQKILPELLSYIETSLVLTSSEVPAVPIKTEAE